MRLKGVFWGRLRIVISVLGSEMLSLVEIEAFLQASEFVRFEGDSRAEVYSWVERLLCRKEYAVQTRLTGGLLRAYAERMTGLSRAQTTRLIGIYLRAGQVRARPSAQATVEIDARGRKRRLYKHRLMPLEKLLSLDEPKQYLRAGLTVQALQRVACAISDTDSAKRLQTARATLGDQIQPSA